MNELLFFAATFAGGAAAGALLVVAWYADTARENKQLRNEVKAYKRKIHALHGQIILGEEELARIYENTGRVQNDQNR